MIDCINGSPEVAPGQRECHSQWFGHNRTVEVSQCETCRYRNRQNKDIDKLVAQHRRQRRRAIPWLLRLQRWLGWRNEYPAPSQQLLSVGTSVVRHVTGGARKVPEDRFAERLEVCKQCEHYDRIAERCRICGCNVDHRRFMNKLRMSSEACPVGRWSADV